MRYRLGLKPPRPGAVKMQARSYRTPAPVDLSGTLGRYKAVKLWHMLGNDQWSNCFWAGRAHELYLRSALKGNRVHVTTQDTLDDYHDCTGFDETKPDTDQGTDLQKGAAYCQKIGIRDVTGKIRHKDGAYAAITPGNLAEAIDAIKEFGSAGIGIQIGDAQQDQFENGHPWDGQIGPNPGYHYVPLIDWLGGMLVCITWGHLQLISPSFFENQCSEGLAYIPEESMTPKMADDLAQLTKGTSA